MKNTSKFLTPCQQRLLELDDPSKNTRGWDAVTMKKVIRMRIICGARGYEEMRLHHHHPLPALCVINRRLSNLNLIPGAFFELLKHLQHKLSQESLPSANLCVFSLDEMKTAERIEYDKGLKRYLGYISPEIARNEEEKSKKASHCMALMVRGLTSHWKQLLTYISTGNSIDRVKMWQFIERIITVLTDHNIIVVAVSSDMGSANQGMWHLQGIEYSRKEVKPSAPHPAPSEDVKDLYFTPDVPHLVKNMWAQLLRTVFFASSNWCAKHGLNSNIISPEHVHEFVRLQGTTGIRPVPGLNEAALNPSKFEKMRVPTALSFFSEKLGHAIVHASESGLISSAAKTTGFFILDVARWYSIMSARSQFTGLGNSEKSKQDVDLLVEFMELIKGLTFWRIKGKRMDFQWKPIQGGVLLATTTVVELWKTFVLPGKLKYLLPSRLFSSGCENLFCQVRGGGDVHPGPVKLRHMLRLISVAQYLRTPANAAYEDDDEPYYIDFLKSTSFNKNSMDFTFSEEEVDEFLDYTPEEIAALARQGLYFVCGWIAFKLKKKCVSCFSFMSSETPLPDLPSEFTEAVSKGGLCHPSHWLWTIIVYLEDIAKANEKKLLLMSNIDKFLIQCIKKKCAYLANAVPKCHDFIGVVAAKYLSLRVHVLATDQNSSGAEQIDYSSASAYMRTAAKNCKDAQQKNLVQEKEMMKPSTTIMNLRAL